MNVRQVMQIPRKGTARRFTLGFELFCIRWARRMRDGVVGNYFSMMR
jgi:hypothetical protein